MLVILVRVFLWLLHGLQEILYEHRQVLLSGRIRALIAAIGPPVHFFIPLIRLCLHHIFDVLDGRETTHGLIMSTSNRIGPLRAEYLLLLDSIDPRGQVIKALSWPHWLLSLYLLCLLLDSHDVQLQLQISIDLGSGRFLRLNEVSRFKVLGLLNLLECVIGEVGTLRRLLLVLTVVQIRPYIGESGLQVLQLVIKSCLIKRAVIAIHHELGIIPRLVVLTGARYSPERSGVLESLVADLLTVPVSRHYRYVLRLRIHIGTRVHLVISHPLS